MKIAFDYQIFSQQSYGGISRYYSRLARELLKLEQDVSIFAGVHRNNYLSNLPNGVVKGRKLAKYPPKTAKLFQYANHYWLNYQINAWKPQVIHETYYSIVSSTSKRIPRIVTALDMIHELFSEDMKKLGLSFDLHHQRNLAYLFWVSI